MKWTVPAQWDGERADKVLAHLSGCSRASARAALESGTVTIEAGVTAPTNRVRAGEELVGEIPDLHRPLQPEPVPFGVPFEDEHMAVIDKPAGIVTHPGAGNRSGTLAGGLLHRWPQIRGVGVEGRWGIVHRLDRDTSGLLAVALGQEAFEGLSTAIKRREVAREYLCLVTGVPASPTGTIDAPIGRDPRRPTRMTVDPDGRHAVTHYRVERSIDDGTLLSVSLETGRTHQIRVHLASIGIPVAGDRVYGTGGRTHRLFLHSTRLSLRHPVTGEPVDVESPLPPDLKVALSPPTA